MTKVQVFWYLSEALLLALYIGFFAIISNSMWFGIAAGVITVVLRNTVSKALDKAIKVKK